MSDFALEFLGVSCTFRASDASAARYTALADTTLRVRAG